MSRQILIAALIALAGCASPGPGKIHSDFFVSPETRPGYSPPPATAPATPSCPASIALEAPLDDSVLHRAGSWVPDLSATTFGWSKPVPWTATAKSKAGATPIELIGAGSSAHLVTPHEGGYCVINSWSSLLPGRADLSLAGTWRSPKNGSVAFLLKVRHELSEGGPFENRWVVIATDGTRAWLPLKGDHGHQVISPLVAFRAQGSKLFLDVGPKNRGKVVFVLRKNGKFERLN